MNDIYYCAREGFCFSISVMNAFSHVNIFNYKRRVNGYNNPKVTFSKLKTSKVHLLNVKYHSLGAIRAYINIYIIFLALWSVLILQISPVYFGIQPGGKSRFILNFDLDHAYFWRISILLTFPLTWANAQKRSWRVWLIFLSLL